MKHIDGSELPPYPVHPLAWVIVFLTFPLCWLFDSHNVWVDELDDNEKWRTICEMRE